MNRKQRTIAVNIIVIILILCGLAWILSLFIHPGGKEYTNNAQIKQDIVSVDSRVQGFVKEVRYGEFQHVKKGDTLLIIEDAEYQLQLAQAVANYQSALAAKSVQGTTIKTTQNNISVSDARLQELRVRLQNSEKEYNRYRKLLAGESVTQQQFDAVETQYHALKAQFEATRRQQQSTCLSASEQTQRLDQNQAAIAVAEAALELARLNLGYTVILAPCDGYTSRKIIHPGELVHQGQALVSVVNDGESWVIANFRERQLKHIEVGSKVKISVDAIPGVTLHGVVSAISNASGDQYSVVPQDNSTGNFVKVEQRVPIKITLPSQQNKGSILNKLKSGMNVECRIVK